MKDLQGEEPLAAVAKVFFDWCGDCDTLIAWSGNDFGVLEKNLAHIGMKIPEQLGRYDVQMAYAYRTENSIRNYALKAAGTGGTGIPRCLLRRSVYSCYRAGTNRTLRTLTGRRRTAGAEKYPGKAKKAQAATDV